MNGDGCCCFPWNGRLFRVVREEGISPLCIGIVPMFYKSFYCHYLVWYLLLGGLVVLAVVPSLVVGLSLRRRVLHFYTNIRVCWFTPWSLLPQVFNDKFILHVCVCVYVIHSIHIWIVCVFKRVSLWISMIDSKVNWIVFWWKRLTCKLDAG